MRQGRKQGRDEHALTPGRPRPTEPWRERYHQAMHNGQRQDAANLALGALFAASHGTHHALSDLGMLLAESRRPERTAGAEYGSIDELCAAAARGLCAVHAAGCALAVALFDTPIEPSPQPAPGVEPLGLGQAVAEAHELLTRLVASWHAVTDGERSLAEFGATLGGLLGELARLELRIRPSEGSR